MAGKKDSTILSDDVDCLVINGVEYFAKRYSGGSESSTSNEKSHLYEASLKKSMEKKKIMYPIHSDTFHNTISVTTPSTTNKPKVSGNGDSPIENSVGILISKSGTCELERLVVELENYLSVLKYRLQKYKEQESQQSRRGRQDTLVEAIEESEEFGTAINEKEPSGGERAVVMASDDE